MSRKRILGKEGEPALTEHAAQRRRVLTAGGTWQPALAKPTSVRTRTVARSGPPTNLQRRLQTTGSQAAVRAVARQVLSAATASVKSLKAEMAAAGGLGGGDGSESNDSSSQEALETQRTRALRRRAARRSRCLGGGSLGDDGRLSFLETRAVSCRTHLDYKQRATRFLQWAEGAAVPLTLATDMDVAMVEYMNRLFFEGEAPSSAEKTLAAVVHHLQECGRRGQLGLPRAWRCLVGWRKVTPPRSRDPWAWPVWALIASRMALSENLLMAVMLLLCVAIYARPGELLRLQRQDILPPVPQVQQSWTIILFPSDRLPRSKVGEADDSMVMDFKYLQWFSPVLRALAQGQKDEMVFNFGYPSFSSALGRCVTAERLPHIVAYQARHSGASIDAAERSRTLEQIRKRGRWKTAKSVMRYEKAGRLQKTFLQLTGAQQHRAYRAAAGLEDVILRGVGGKL